MLSFFEVQPEPRDSDIGWPYNDFLYRIERDPFTLSCSIAPAYRDVRLILEMEGMVVYELNATGVQDVRYSRYETTETLEIVLSDRESIELRVKPKISIAHRFEEPT